MKKQTRQVRRIPFIDCPKQFPWIFFCFDSFCKALERTKNHSIVCKGESRPAEGREKNLHNFGLSIENVNDDVGEKCFMAV